MRELVYLLRLDWRAIETAGDTTYHAGGVVEAHRMGRVLVVARRGFWVQVTPTNWRTNRTDGGSSCDLIETGRSWPIGDVEGTGMSTIDGVNYRYASVAWPIGR